MRYVLESMIDDIKNNKMLFLGIFCIFVGIGIFGYIAIQRKYERESDIAALCLSKGFEPNNYDIQTGKTSETVRFCVDAKGVMYWPKKLEQN